MDRRKLKVVFDFADTYQSVIRSEDIVILRREDTATRYGQRRLSGFALFGNDGDYLDNILTC
jgi:hypothetical protein